MAPSKSSRTARIVQREDAYAAAYARTSSAAQEEKETIDHQKKAIPLASGLYGDADLHWYEDPGQSGISQRTAERRAGRRLLADVAAGRVRRLYCYRYDRLGRDHEDGVGVLSQLRAAGVEVVSVKEGAADLRSPIGWMLANLHNLIAEFGMKTHLETMREAKGNRVDEGRWVGGRVAFGYKLAGEGKARHHVIDREVPERWQVSPAGVVERVFLLAAAGHSLVSIARVLNGEGVPTRGQLVGQKNAAAHWNEAHLSGLVANPIYKGERQWGGRPDCTHFVEAKMQRVPAIVTPALWAEANARVSASARGGGAARLRHYPLTGVLRCGTPGCDYGLSGASVRGGQQNYYVCNSRVTGKHAAVKAPHCGAGYLRAEPLEVAVWARVAALLRGDASFDEAVAGQAVAREAEVLAAEAERATIAAAEAEVRGRRARLTDLLVRGVVLEDDYQRQVVALRAEEGRLGERALLVAARGEGTAALGAAAEEFRARLAEARLAWVDNGEPDWGLVRDLVYRVEPAVDGGGALWVTWKAGVEEEVGPVAGEGPGEGEGGGGSVGVIKASSRQTLLYPYRSRVPLAA